MCLLIFAHHAHPDYPLVVAANRDEFHARPTAASGFWPEHPELLAGKDLELGGTWMGITREGRFAAVTNYRDPSRTAPAPRSRGELALEFLTGNRPPPDYLGDLAGRAGDYAGFNLLLGDGEELWYLTNSSPQGQWEPLLLESGIYGLSNARLDTPWPKVQLGKQRLQLLLETVAPNHDALQDVVADRQLASPETLRRHGMGDGMDQLLSAQFIVTGSYGTRSSTSLWIDGEGRSHWRELSFDPRGGLVGTVEEQFKRNNR
jgi:uncharacterized protein with NRDE domain